MVILKDFIHKLKRYKYLNTWLNNWPRKWNGNCINSINSWKFCSEFGFAAFQSISPVKDSSRLECVPRDFLLTVFCAKWKWEMKNITTFPKNGHTSKNTGSIMLTLDRYRKYTYTTYQDSLRGCSMYLRRFNGKWERNKLARARTRVAGSPTFSLACARFFLPVSPTPVVQAREQCTRGSHPVHRVFTKKPFLREKPW